MASELSYRKFCRQENANREVFALLPIKDLLPLIHINQKLETKTVSTSNESGVWTPGSYQTICLIAACCLISEKTQLSVFA